MFVYHHFCSCYTQHGVFIPGSTSGVCHQPVRQRQLHLEPHQRPAGPGGPARRHRSPGLPPTGAAHVGLPTNTARGRGGYSTVRCDGSWNPPGKRLARQGPCCQPTRQVTVSRLRGGVDSGGKGRGWRVTFWEEGIQGFSSFCLFFNFGRVFFFPHVAVPFNPFSQP